MSFKSLNRFARNLPDADDAVGETKRLWRQGRSLATHGMTEPPAKRAGSIVGSLVVGTVLLGAGALAAQWLRERSETEPDYDVLREDGPISMRRYRPMIVATANIGGSMKNAMESGFRRLFAYISGKTRPSGEDTRIAMTVPVIAAPSDHPGGWLIRFVMPTGKPIQALPQPGMGVTIDEVPGRMIAAIRFPGRITEQSMATGELNELRTWIEAQGFKAKGEPEFAAYNSPIIPGPMRRNEWWIEVGEAAG
jgi:hypothetical protein